MIIFLYVLGVIGFIPFFTNLPRPDNTATISFGAGIVMSIFWPVVVLVATILTIISYLQS